MSRRDPELLLQTSPFQAQRLSLPKLMSEVHLALLPVILASLWFFGLGALLVLLAATAGAVGTEWLFARVRPRHESLADGSAALTGVLLGLILPPGLPLWMAFLGGVAAIGLGKLVWGGLGHNLFNPALVGRAFLQAAFPTALTTWSPSGGPFLQLDGNNLAFPFLQGSVDAVTTATPLAKMKFEQVFTPEMPLLFGNTGGSIGETSALILIAVGLFLGIRRVFDWRIPTAILLTVALLSAVFWVASPEKFPSPWFMLTSGGLLFGAVFMATDPVTSPLAPAGAWIFGIGIGCLVVLIRLFGGLPEGVMYAILLMNAATPLIERKFQPRVFGRGKRADATVGGAS